MHRVSEVFDAKEASTATISNDTAIPHPNPLPAVAGRGRFRCLSREIAEQNGA